MDPIDPSDFTTKNLFIDACLPSMVKQGIDEKKARSILNSMWEKNGKPVSRLKTRVSSSSRTSKKASKSKSDRRSRVSKTTVFKRIDVAPGDLDPREARDAAIGLLEGLLLLSKSQEDAEYYLMEMQAQERFGEDEEDLLTSKDANERSFGRELATYLVQLLMQRNISWDTLSPRALDRKLSGTVARAQDVPMPAFEPPRELTAEEELGISVEGTRRRPSQTAVQATVSALTEILDS